MSETHQVKEASNGANLERPEIRDACAFFSFLIRSDRFGGGQFPSGAYSVDSREDRC